MLIWFWHSAQNMFNFSFGCSFLLSQTKWQTNLTWTSSHSFPDDTIPLRLIGNATEEAIVEVSNGFIWGRICTDSWGFDHAEIVCKQFGYNGALAAFAVKSNYSSNESKQVFLNFDLTSGRCYRDDDFESCLRSKITSNCECRNDNAGLICSKFNIYIF